MNGWGARRFIGEDGQRTRLQLRLWFAKRVLGALECNESLAKLIVAGSLRSIV
jgi:hypothetical protein